MEIDIEKLEKGLFLRRELAKSYRRGAVDLSDHFEERHQSIGRDYYSSTFLDRTISSDGAIRDIGLTHFIMHVDDVVSQERAYSNVKRFFHKPYAGRLIIGRFAGFDTENLGHIKSAIDYSLVLQSLMTESKLALGDALSPYFANYFSDIRKIYRIAGPIETIADLSKLLNSQPAIDRYSTLQYCNRILAEIKRENWFVTGVDVLNILQRLITPDAYYQQQQLISQCDFDLLEIAGMRPIADRMLQIWSGVEHVKTSSAYNNIDIKFPIEPLPREVRKRTLELLEDGARGRFKDITPVSVGLSRHLLQRLEWALDSNRHRLAFRLVTLLFELDDNLLRHLDWEYLDEEMSPELGIRTIESCFFELLFTEYSHPIIHSDIRWWRGVGDFIADLSMIFEQLRNENKSHREFLQHFKNSLPPRAASKLTEAFLKRQYFARLYQRFPPTWAPVEGKDEVAKAEDLLTRHRLLFANHALGLKLISEKVYRDIVAHEKSSVEFRIFQREFGEGRIRLPWFFLKKRAHEFVEATLSYFVLNDIDSNQISENQELIEVIVAAGFDEFVHQMIFDSAFGFDTVLAANLRHGVIITVYASIFVKAISECGYSTKYTAAWDENSMRAMFRDSFDEIDKARSFTIERLDAFIKSHLVIDPESKFYQRLESGVVAEVIDILSLPIEERSKSFDRVFNFLKAQFVEVVDGFRSEFQNIVIPELAACIASLNKHQGNDETPYTKYVDCLKTLFNECNKNVLQWMNVVTDENESKDFSIRNLIKFEAKMIHLQEMEDLAISITCEANGKSVSDLRFEGRFRPLLNEIIHNLISNAFKHSGYDVQTDITMSFAYNDNTLTINVANDLTSTARAKALRNLPFARKLAHGDFVVAAGDEKHTGFAKIRGVARQLTDCKINIGVDIDLSSQPLYLVTLTLSRILAEIVND